MGPKLILLSLLILHLNSIKGISQEIINEQAIQSGDTRLLDNALIQMEATAAVNDMYNFKFERAAKQFEWFQEKYPEHPLPYFLLGLNQWWQIMPNDEVEKYDEDFFYYMDLSIDKARSLYREDKDNAEAAFFLSAAYAFKSRLNAERKNWTRATFNGKSALKFLRKGKETNELSPELLLGDGLYNYYSVWIPEHYPLLKPVLLFFRKGDQEKGIEQLKKVAEEAFYTRTEAQYFLMRIYRSDEKKPQKALPIAEYLHKTFPDNAYFHRYYASVLFVLGRLAETQREAQKILERVESKQIGYEAVSGRYASYYLGFVSKLWNRNSEKTREYYLKTLEFSERSGHLSSGYYHNALYELARMSVKDKDIGQAKVYYKKLKDELKRKDKRHKEAREYLRKHRKFE